MVNEAGRLFPPFVEWWKHTAPAPYYGPIVIPAGPMKPAPSDYARAARAILKLEPSERETILGFMQGEHAAGIALELAYMVDEANEDV